MWDKIEKTWMHLENLYFQLFRLMFEKNDDSWELFKKKDLYLEE